MRACSCTYKLVWVYVWMDICTKARSQYLEFFSIILHLILRGRVSHLNTKLIGLDGLTKVLPDLPASNSQFWGSKFKFQACTTSTCSTEPSPQPLTPNFSLCSSIYYFQCFLFLPKNPNFPEVILLLPERMSYFLSCRPGGHLSSCFVFILEAAFSTIPTGGFCLGILRCQSSAFWYPLYPMTTLHLPCHCPQLCCHFPLATVKAQPVFFNNWTCPM